MPAPNGEIFQCTAFRPGFFGSLRTNGHPVGEPLPSLALSGMISSVFAPAERNVDQILPVSSEDYLLLDPTIQNRSLLDFLTTNESCSDSALSYVHDSTVDCRPETAFWTHLEPLRERFCFSNSSAARSPASVKASGGSGGARLSKAMNAVPLPATFRSRASPCS